MSGSVDGGFVCGSLSSSGSITCPDNGIPSRCVVHRFTRSHNAVAGTDVAALTIPIHHFRKAGKVIAVNVVPYTAPTGGDKAYTVDVKLGNQSTSPATILSGVVTINSSDADRQVNAGSLTSSPTICAAGDIVTVVVAVSGSTGSQGQGYTVSVVIEENAE